MEDALMAAGYIATFFILYGGFKYLTSQGTPTIIAEARTTILDAIIGLVISIIAIGFVNFIVTGILG
jgi:hypothetical protein